MRTFLLLSALVLLSSPGPIGAQAPAAAETVLEGQVLNAVTGAPVSGARVKLAKSPNDEGSFTRTDERGRFHFSPPPADGYGYTLSAQSPGFLRPESINVSANPVIKLTPSAVITGKVTDPYGLPVSGCMIEILRKQAVQPGAASEPFAHPRQFYTDDKGEFRAAPLEAGAYYVVTGRPAWGPWDKTYRNTYYPRAADLASAKPLELTAGQRVRADIQILRRTGVRVAGRIVSPSSQEDQSGPALRTHITLVPENSPQLNPARPFANAKENYEIGEVLPGKYVLMASVYDLTSGPSDGGYKETFGAMQRLDVGDQDVVGADVVLQPFRDLAGAVTFPAGCTPVPLRIVAQGQPPLGFASVETVSGADGKFLLSPRQTGRYVLYLTNSRGNTPRVLSTRLGDRDVLKDGFEMPFAGAGTLSVSVDCPGKESVR